jgi:aryl-alcohol dehydrogenase-like predicted oxidoreductase
MARIGNSELEVFPLALGGNVFGWTADAAASQQVLDAYVDGGGNFIDTADSYSVWIPGHKGGESETIIGEWAKARGNRDKLVIATKVGQQPEARGTSRTSVRHQIEASLRRLQTDYIDLYYAHVDDADTPLEETIGVFGELVAEGKVRYVAASNFSGERLQAALDTAGRLGAPKYVALQPHYNLIHRKDYEDGARKVVEANGLSTIPYYALASGFLTGKYRDGGPDVDSPRAGGAAKNLDDRGRAVLAELDRIAAVHNTSVTAVSLAWLRVQPTIAAPIASASKVEQVPDLLAGARLELTAEEIQALSNISAQ